MRECLRFSSEKSNSKKKLNIEHSAVVSCGDATIRLSYIQIH